MDRTATKEAAEALLRELPSVVGAYVLEDIYGHPREIHVLIHAGPSARHFARDVRDLLEEGLGVPVDQRVISIAQLAGEPARPGEAPGMPARGTPAFGSAGDAPGEDPVVSDPVVSDPVVSDPVVSDPDAIDPAMRETAGDTAAGAAPPSASAGPAVPPDTRSARRYVPRMLLESTALERSEGRVTVRVRLRHDGSVFEAEDTQIDTPQARLRAGARALLAAATHAARDGARFALEEAATTRALGRDYVMLTVIAQAARLGRRPLVLAGAQSVDEELEVTAALAALKAINRVFARLAAPAAG
jgi:hypothetical protein